MTLITLFSNIPYALILLIGTLRPVPMQSGGEAYLIFTPIIIIGWLYAATYVFYFPYYIIRYKSWDSITKIGLGVYIAIVITAVIFFGYLTYLSSVRN